MAVPELNFSKKVSVCILHFNRMDELIVTVGHIINSTYKNIEIIIVDNASDNFNELEIRKLFAEIKIIYLQHNIGISGWNEAFKIASGDYFLVLDDDSYPDESAIEKAVKIFSADSNLGIIAAKVNNVRTGKIETDDFHESPDFFVGCGAFITRKVFETIGGFNELIFIYLHELDYSARTYDAGFTIKYLPEIIVYHMQSENRIFGKNRNPYLSSFRYYHYAVSYSIFLLQYFYWGDVIKYLPKWFINRLIVSVKYGFFKEFFKSLIFVVSHFMKIIAGRKPLKEETQKFYRYGNIPFIDHDYLWKHER